MSVTREELAGGTLGGEHRAPRGGAGAWTASLVLSRVAPYLALMRADHWTKNAFMLLGFGLAFFYRPELLSAASAPRVLWALAATCLVASSNYVLNEWLDAPMDRLHPKRCGRPAALGLVHGPIVLAQWLTVGGAGIAMAFAASGPLGCTATALWIAGCLYNVPPVRTKDIPYLDVLSESFNNPLRLMLGWYALVPDRIPPLSLALAYWMLGAFLMAAKRLAEVRAMRDRALLERYRPVFRTYDEPRLLGSMVFYVTLGALFSGIFVVRYKLELILCVPLMAGFFTRYLRLTLEPDSPVQTPEQLWRVPRFCSYAFVCLLSFVGLMVVEVPALYELFAVEPSGFTPLWRIGP